LEVEEMIHKEVLQLFQQLHQLVVDLKVLQEDLVVELILQVLEDMAIHLLLVHLKVIQGVLQIQYLQIMVQVEEGVLEEQVQVVLLLLVVQEAMV
jgi:hypothetical protein